MHDAYADRQRWILARNVGSSVIPSYGAVQIVGWENVDFRTIRALVDKPTHAKHESQQALNGEKPIPIPFGTTPALGAITRDWPAVARIPVSGLASGRTVGVTQGSFNLDAHHAGFVVLGPGPAVDTYRVAQISSQNSVVVLKSNLAAASCSGTPGSPDYKVITTSGRAIIMEMDENTDFVSSGIEIDVYNMINATVNSDRPLQVKPINGHLFVDVEGCKECPPSTGS